MEPASRPAVGLGRGPTGGPWLDVVDVTVGGGDVAELVEALPVPQLHGPSRCAIEHLRVTPTSITRLGPSKTSRSTQAWSNHGRRLPGVTTVPSASSQIIAANVS